MALAVAYCAYWKHARDARALQAALLTELQAHADDQKVIELMTGGDNSVTLTVTSAEEDLKSSPPTSSPSPPIGRAQSPPKGRSKAGDMSSQALEVMAKEGKLGFSGNLRSPVQSPSLSPSLSPTCTGGIPPLSSLSGHIPTLKGTHREPPTMLSIAELQAIQSSLPHRCQCAEWWTLRYSSLEHGSSFKTLYRNVVDVPNVLLVLQTMTGEKFGAFTSTPLHPTYKKIYAGTGETFVYTFSTDVTGASRFKKFPWAKKNNYFVMAHPDCLAFGGGGHFAISLEESLLCGTTGPCETFGSPSLVHANDKQSENFFIFAMELWHVPDVYEVRVQSMLKSNAVPVAGQLKTKLMPVKAMAKEGKAGDAADASLRLPSWAVVTISRSKVADLAELSSQIFSGGFSFASLTLLEAVNQVQPTGLKYVLAVDPSVASEAATDFITTLLRQDDHVYVLAAGSQYHPISRTREKLTPLLPEGHALYKREEATTDTAKLIVTYAQDKQVDVIVVGNRGLYSGAQAERWSVSTQVLHQVRDQAVLVIRQSVAAPPTGTPHRYLVCVDGSPCALKAILVVLRMLRPVDEVYVYNAYRMQRGHAEQARCVSSGGGGGDGTTSEDGGSYTETGRSYSSLSPMSPAIFSPSMDGTTADPLLEREMWVSNARRVVVEAEVVPEENVFAYIEGTAEPMRATIMFAKKNHLHTIVCGSRGMGSVASIVFGSFSTYLIHNATKQAVLVTR